MLRLSGAQPWSGNIGLREALEPVSKRQPWLQRRHSHPVVMRLHLERPGALRALLEAGVVTGSSSAKHPGDSMIRDRLLSAATAR